MSGRFIVAVGRMRWFLAGALLLTVLPAAVRADLTGPTAEDRRITLAVKTYMKDNHITRHDLNDEIAERMLTNFLKTLDQQKRFFYQTDVDQFRAQQDDLDDEIDRGHVEFAFKVFQVYLTRLDERVKWIEMLGPSFCPP